MLIIGRANYIVIQKDFSYDTSYMIYGKDRILDPRFCFAYYLIHTDKDKFVPWLKLEKDDEKFRIFSIRAENTALSDEKTAEKRS